eukprot:1991534-Prymnesium_polylepis.2
MYEPVSCQCPWVGSDATAHCPCPMSRHAHGVSPPRATGFSAIGHTGDALFSHRAPLPCVLQDWHCSGRLCFELVVPTPIPPRLGHALHQLQMLLHAGPLVRSAHRLRKSRIAALSLGSTACRCT